MSRLAQIVDAWVEELTANVDGLEDVKEHRYAPWSAEALGAVTNERHLAVWPQSESEVVEGYLAGSPPADLATQSFVILVWEDASAESMRRMDSEEANLEWLDLHEAIRDRLYVWDNRSLGDPLIQDSRYQGVTFDALGAAGRATGTAGLRVMAIRFEVRVPLPYTLTGP